MDYIISIIIILIYIILIFFNQIDIILLSLLIIIIAVCIKNKMEDEGMSNEVIEPIKEKHTERKLELIDYFIIIPFVAGWIISSMNYLLVGCILMVFGTFVCFAKNKILCIIKILKQKKGRKE